MRTRVIQWATGPVGAAQLREIIASPDLELAGVFVYSPEKVGVDAGALVGAPPTGVVATNDKAQILALDADVVLHSASKVGGFESNTADIVALLESGKSVITTTSYAHLPTLGPEVDARIQQACDKSGARFHAAGEHPGFMLERLAVALTALSQRVDRITLRQYVDCSRVPEKRMLVDLMGMGRRPEEISDESPAFRAVSIQAKQALAAAADVLGLPVDEIRHAIRTAVVEHDVEVACTTLPAGSVVGQILSWTAYRGGSPVLACEEYWTCTRDIPEWNLALEGQTVRVSVEGAPNLRLELVVDTDPIPELGGASGGYVAVGMSALRAIPYVLKATPGVVKPEIFGAYRWR
jgi:2,4-diaminopentanoate dehydrogenase